ncbi:MAG: hypothetical protein QM784_35320 [Polyangiaceae bacterium]
MTLTEPNPERESATDGGCEQFGFSNVSRRLTNRILGATLLCFTLLGLLTRSASAYRTNADSLEIVSTERVVWPQASVELQLGSIETSPYTPEQTRLAVEEAITEWSSPSCSSLYLELLASQGTMAVPGDELNTVQWQSDGWLGGPSAPGYTDVQLAKSTDGSWVIAEADIYLNSNHASFIESGKSSEYLRAIIAHELGHVVGLTHPCEMVAAADVPVCGAGNEAQLMHPIS